MQTAEQSLYAEDSMPEILDQDDDFLADDGSDVFDPDEAFLAEEIRMRMDR